MDEKRMVAVIRVLVDQLGGVREAARQWGCSPAYLSDVLNGRRGPGPAVLKPIGYEKRVVTSFHKA